MSVYKAYAKVLNKLSLAAFVLLIFVAGCGGGGGGGTGSGGGGGNGGSSGPSDFTAPTVTSMTPGQDSSGMATNSKLTATLSEAMVAAAINTDNFRLTDGSVAADGVTLILLPGTVSYDSANHIAVFTPTGGLAPNTRYTATVITGIKDLGNNPLTVDFAWDFETGGAADNTAPSVTFTDAATGVAVNRMITATFSQDMDSSTITPASFTVKGPGATAVAGTVTYLNRTAVFAPSQNLASNTLYTAAITTGAMDLAGNAAQAMTWNFTTGTNPDVAAPVATSTSPVDSASGVAINSTINVTLSEPMDPTTITTANFLVTGPGTTPVIGIVVFDATNNTAIFTRHNHLTTPVVDPVINLEPGTTYTVRLTTGARDMAGNALANDKVWSFSTAP